MRPMKFRLGDSANCARCNTAFSVAHPKQKFCSRGCAKKYKQEHRKKYDRAAYYTKYYETAKAKIRAKSKEYYEANKQMLSEKQKIYKASLPEEIVLERRARYYATHKAREKRRYHATRVWLPWLNAFRGSKARAVKRNIPFTITKEWAIKRWTGRCEVTGIEFILSDKRSPYLFSPSLDRIIPSLGYTSENSRFVLHAVNALKGEGTDEDMIRIAKAIVFSG